MSRNRVDWIIDKMTDRCREWNRRRGEGTGEVQIIDGVKLATTNGRM